MNAYFDDNSVRMGVGVCVVMVVIVRVYTSRGKWGVRMYGGKVSGKYMSEGSEAVTDLVRAVDDDELPISPLLRCSGRQGAV